MAKSTITGRVDTFKLKCNDFIVDKNRTIRVFVPQKYDANRSTKYKVFYMLDGNNLFDEKTATFHKEWGFDEVLTKMENEGFDIPLIVGIDCSKNRKYEYLPPIASRTKMIENLAKSLGINKKDADNILTPRGDITLNFLVEKVIPYVEFKYNVSQDPKDRTFGGSSMGGLMSFYCALEYRKYFDNYICLSPAFFHLDTNPLEKFIKVGPNYIENRNRFKLDKNMKIYLACGGDDFESIFVPHYYDFVNYLSQFDNFKTNIKHSYNLEDVHDENQWHRHIEAIVHFICC